MNKSNTIICPTQGILADPVTETIDLAKVTPARGQELVNLAFKEPLSLANQIRVTFIVGAGKLGRQKVICAALVFKHVASQIQYIHTYVCLLT